MKVKLAEALLRRKELEAKVKVLMVIKANMIIETKVARVKVADGFDDMTITYNRLSPSEVTAELDFHSRALRLCDAAIQQMNWTAELEDAEKFMNDYVPPKKEEVKEIKT